MTSLTDRSTAPAPDPNAPTGWGDTGWTVQDAAWFSNTTLRRAALLQAPLTDGTLIRYADALGAVAGVVDRTDAHDDGVRNDGVRNDGDDERTAEQDADRPSDHRSDDHHLDSGCDWSNTVDSRRWWTERKNAWTTAGSAPSLAHPEQQDLKPSDVTPSDVMPADSNDSNQPNSNRERPDEARAVEAAIEAAQSAADDMERDRAAVLDRTRPTHVAAEEWTDLVAAAWALDADDRAAIGQTLNTTARAAPALKVGGVGEETVALAWSVERRRRFRVGRWPHPLGRWLGWPDAGVRTGARTLWKQAVAAAALLEHALAPAAAAHRTVMRAWSGHMTAQRHDQTQRRRTATHRWRAQVAAQVLDRLADLPDDRPTDAPDVVRAVNGWGHLMLGGGHDRWSGWIALRRAGVWDDAQEADGDDFEKHPGTTDTGSPQAHEPQAHEPQAHE